MKAKREFFLFGAIISLLFLVLVAAVYIYLPVNVDWEYGGPFSIGVDWKDAFRPAVLNMLQGKPFYGSGFYNPPWALLPLIPIALLPPGLGAAVIFVLSIYTFAFVSMRLNKNLPATIALILSTVAVGGYINGNIDFLVVLGFIMPPWLGLFFVLMKPQLSFGVIAFWLFEAWQKGAPPDDNSEISFWHMNARHKLLWLWRHSYPVMITFAPVTLAFLLSFLILGFWPATYQNRTADPFNDSLWPHGFFIGLVILFQALKTRNFRLAIIAGPFLSPYITNHGWAVALLGIGNVETIVVSVGLWIWRFTFRTM